MDTIPLLSPTTESELFRDDGWSFPPAKKPKQEDNTAYPIWEENFQDLSSWCMDPIQGQCNFPVGELNTFGISGTKNEGELSLESGGLKDFYAVADIEKPSAKMDAINQVDVVDDSCNFVTPSLLHTQQPKKELYNTEISITDFLNNLTKGTNATVTLNQNKPSNSNVNTTLPTEYNIDNLNLDNTIPSKSEPNEYQQDTWDVLRSVETTGSDAFDLLSYVCDDELRSPEGSTSTDSSMVSKLRSPTQGLSTLEYANSIVGSPEIKHEVIEPISQSRSTAASSNSSTIAPIVSIPRRSERSRTISVSKVEKIRPMERRSRVGKKRYSESDSDDELSVPNYRESREKNNEASRKSRMNKKAKEIEMSSRAVELERDNRILKMKVDELEKLVTSMRSALLRSALKKGF